MLFKDEYRYMNQTLSNPDITMTNFHGILTSSQNMEHFFELLKRAAPTDASILIRGDTGTGKELVARAIHELSHRSHKPFRAINCATLSAELLVSELFGHVKGAFTGAINNRDGVFKIVDGGTLFLDEIAEMPIDIQSRLLRVLQEQVFVPMGATTPIKVDVRILSATLSSLREGVEQGTFRADLMYRIRVLPLFLSRLTERGRDMEALAWHFIEELNQKSTDRKVRHISAAAMDAMMHYSWPGNIRELQNVVHYAFILGQGDCIELQDLTPEISGQQLSTQAPTKQAQTAWDIEHELLLDAYRTTRGKREQMADMLGMSRTTLWRKLKEHHIT